MYTPPGYFPTRKLFVGGLPVDITNENLSEYFEQFGKLTDVAIMSDRNSGKPRGFGFIVFEEESSVDKVVNNYKNNFIKGK